LLSPISYALQCRIVLHRENPTYGYWAAATHGFKMVLRRTTAATRGFTMVLSIGTTLSEVHALNECPSSFVFLLVVHALFSAYKYVSYLAYFLHF